MSPSRPTSWYEASSVPRIERPELDFATDADVCVVGGGLAGLTVARQLARKGWDVVLVEADRIAAGASGRNSGLVQGGFAMEPAEIERRVGVDHARALLALAHEGLSHIRSVVETQRMPGVALTPGVLTVMRHTAGLDAFRAETERAAKLYGGTPLFWSREKVREALGSDAFHAGFYDTQSFHIHPLNYGLGLAADAARAGARLYERTPALDLDLRSIRRIVRTPKGSVRCNRIVLCGSTTLPAGVQARIAGAVLPLSGSVAVTEPLGDRLGEVMRFAGAVRDTRRAATSFRIVDGSRLLWGDRLSARRGTPAGLARAMARDMARTFPSLKGVRVEHAWSGVMATSRHGMPQIGEVQRDVWVASAFGGHGLNTTAMAGLVLARALIDRDDAYRLFTPFPLSATFGPAGRLAARARCWWMRMKDRLDERQG